MSKYNIINKDELAKVFDELPETKHLPGSVKKKMADGVAERMGNEIVTLVKKQMGKK